MASRNVKSTQRELLNWHDEWLAKTGFKFSVRVGILIKAGFLEIAALGQPKGLIVLANSWLLCRRIKISKWFLGLQPCWVLQSSLGVCPKTCNRMNPNLGWLDVFTNSWAVVGLYEHSRPLPDIPGINYRKTHRISEDFFFLNEPDPPNTYLRNKREFVTGPGKFMATSN